MKRARNAFTLIELLMAISIISLLMVLMLPVVSRAKKMARRAMWASAVSALRKDTNLMAYYTFERASGDKTLKNVAPGDVMETDATHKGSHLDGRIHGASWTDQGRFDNPALRFDGGDYVRVPTRDGLGPPAEMTLLAWVNPSGSGQIVNKWDVDWNSEGTSRRGGREMAYLFEISNGRLSFRRNVFVDYWTSQPYTVTSGAKVPLGQWSLVAGTYDRQKLRVYINGEEVAGADGSTMDLQKDFGYVLIGKGFHGLIDELAILSRALSEADLREMYTAGRP